MTRNPFVTPFTGEHIHAAVTAWQRLPSDERATWVAAAQLHRARGDLTTPAAEFMADYLNKTLKRLKREALRP